MSNDLDYMLLASMRKESGINILEASTFVLGLRKMAEETAPIDITGTIEGQFTVPMDQAINLMAQMVSNEFKTQAYYVYYGNMLRGTDRAGIAEEFEDHAKEELVHANYLLRRIGVLSPGGVSIPPYPPPKPLYNAQQIIREMIVVEQIGLSLWKQLHSILGDNPMKYTVEQFLQTEEAHQDELWQFLDPMAPEQQMDEAAAMPEAPKTAAEIFVAARYRKTAEKLAAVKQSWGTGGAHLSSDGKTLHFYEGQTGNHGPIEKPWFMEDLPSHMHGGVSISTAPPDESEPRGVHEATFSIPVEEAKKHPSLHGHLEQAIADAGAQPVVTSPAQKKMHLTPGLGALGGAIGGGIGGALGGHSLLGRGGVLPGAGLGALGGGLLGYAITPSEKQAEKSVLSEHSDHPGYMMVSNLKRLADQSKQLSAAVSVEDNAEPWVESKIDRASEAIDAVHDYMKYKSEKKASHALSADEMAAAGWDRSRAGKKEHSVKEAQAAQSMGKPTVPEHDELVRAGMDRRKKAMMDPNELRAHLASIKKPVQQAAEKASDPHALQKLRAAARQLVGSGAEGMVRTASDAASLKKPVQQAVTALVEDAPHALQKVRTMASGGFENLRFLPQGAAPGAYYAPKNRIPSFKKEGMDRDKVIKDKARELMAKATSGYRSLADMIHHKDQTRMEIAPVDPAALQKQQAPFVVKTNPAAVRPQDPEDHTTVPMRGPLPMPKQAEDASEEESSHLRRNLLIGGGLGLGALGAGLVMQRHGARRAARAATDVFKQRHADMESALEHAAAMNRRDFLRPDFPSGATISRPQYGPYGSVEHTIRGSKEAPQEHVKKVFDRAAAREAAQAAADATREGATLGVNFGGREHRLQLSPSAIAATLGGGVGAGLGYGASRLLPEEKKASLGSLILKHANMLVPAPGADTPEMYVMREQQLIAQQAQGEAAHQKAISAQASQAAQQAQSEAQAAQQQLQEVQQQLQEAQQQAEQASQQQTQSAQQAAEAEARAADHSIQKMQLGMRVNQLRQSLANLVMQDPVSENSGTVSDLAATGQPATPQQQQEAEAQQQQAQQAPPSADTQQQQMEAQNAEQDAQVQEQQAQQAQAQDQAKQSAAKYASFFGGAFEGAGRSAAQGALEHAPEFGRRAAEGAMGAVADKARQYAPHMAAGGLLLGGGGLLAAHVARKNRREDLANAVAEGIRRADADPQQASPLTYAQYYSGQE